MNPARAASRDVEIDLMSEDNPAGMRMIEQTFTITYASADEAAKAQMEATPVYGGKEWAFTSRWDDNGGGNMRMEQLLSKYGFAATFYLNSKTRGNGDYQERFGAQWAKSLMRNDCTVGCHTMTHPMLSQLTLNEIFYEITALKIEREADTDVPINAMAFPFGNHRNGFMPNDLTPQEAIGQSLVRTGQTHVTYTSFSDAKKGIGPKTFSCHWRLQPGDRDSQPAKFDKQLADLMGNEWRHKTHPCISLGVHVWHTDEGFANLEKSLKKYQGRKEFWFANESDYGAYRYLMWHSKLAKVSQDGATVTYCLTRPMSADLGRKVPLTLAVSGAKVASTSGAASAPVAEESRTLIDIAPPSSEPFPTTIDRIENMTNAAKPGDKDVAAKFPGVVFFLRYDEAAKKLYLDMANTSDEQLDSARVTFILPLAYKTALCRRQIGDLAPGKSATLELPLPAENADAAYHEGRPYFIAKVAFEAGGETGWIYATARGKGDGKPMPTVRDAARLAGPIMPDQVDLKALAPLSKPDAALGEETPVGKWIRPQNAATADKTNGEYVDLGSAPGGWLGAANKAVGAAKGGYCAVALDFDAQGAENADVLVTHWRNGEVGGMLLNGEVMADNGKLTGIRPGRNRLIALLPPQPRSTPRFTQRYFIHIAPKQGSIEYVVPEAN